MALVFHSKADRVDSWREALLRHMPGLDFRMLSEPGRVEDVKYALVWKPPARALRQFPNLTYIFSLGAGVDALFREADLPDGVPVVRMVEDGLTQGMIEYVVLHVLRHHRSQPEMEAQQRRREWKDPIAPLAQERRVGMMGLGTLGSACARALAGLGFRTVGWSRTQKDVEGVETFHGAQGLKDFLRGTEILVCLLPLTDDTEGMLGKALFDRLPRGAALINAARGGLQNEDDILAALDSGQLSGATLDVFRTEPLPKDSLFWSHPKVFVSPHNAANTIPDSGARAVAANIRRIEAGQQPLNIVDRKAGY